MIQRSPKANKVDDARFRFRIKLETPKDGFGQSLNELHAWLDRRLGRGNYGLHSVRWSNYLDAIAVHTNEQTLVPDLLKWYDKRFRSTG